jgi:hypothetical protein
MDFTDQIKILATKIPAQLNHIKTEAATRNALVEPFIRALGYDTSDLTEVVPEFGADLDVPGVPKNKKIDYGILQNGKPIILIECKCFNDKLVDGYKQLFHYAVATDTRIGILTNGLIYRFYADLNKPGKLDDTPFLELDMQNLQENLVDELKKITKTSLNIDEMLTAANELKYTGGILEILTEQLSSPDENFVKFFFNRLCPNKSFSGGVKPQFADFTQRALKQFIREQINILLDVSAIGNGFSSASTGSQPSDQNQDSPDDLDKVSQDNQIVTTEDELEGYFIVKSILREVVDPKRIIPKDVQNYFGIFLDNNKKPVCRLHFNNLKNKRLGVLDENKQEEKIYIDNLNEIYKYAERLKTTIECYEKSKVS